MMAPPYYLGQRICIKGQNCTVRFFGELEGAGPDWYGVEWDDGTKGKHDGTYKGKKYFNCLNPLPTAGSFLRNIKVLDVIEGIEFERAVEAKYVSDDRPDEDGLIKISGKVVEEIGFDKIKRQQAQLQSLVYIIVDGMCIQHAGSTFDETRPLIFHVRFPQARELDLSRNLFETFRSVCELLACLPNIVKLRLSGNRFQDLLKKKVEDHHDRIAKITLRQLTELSLDDTLTSWNAVAWVRKHCPLLETLSVSSNYLKSLSCPLHVMNLKSLVLEYNEFTTLWDVIVLRQLPTLEKLELKGNKISSIERKGYPITSFHIFGTNLKYVDLSYNKIDDWSFVDNLNYVFPGLESLRISGNPFYTSAKDVPMNASDEIFMLTLARISGLTGLNFSPISKAERLNAEMFYLSRIGQEMALVPETEEKTVTSRHNRYNELCELYGAPTVVRKLAGEMNPNFLEARLIKFTFYMKKEFVVDAIEDIVMTRAIPKSFDIYRVKGIVARMFNVEKPLTLKLVWETGEWDPVAGFDEFDKDGDEDVDDEEERVALEMQHLEIGGVRGKWMKREVELVDGTRCVGFWVDGMEAKVRVEFREFK